MFRSKGSLSEGQFSKMVVDTLCTYMYIHAMLL